MAVVEGVAATVVVAAVVFGVRGVPVGEVHWPFIALVTAFSAVNGVLACTRLRWLGGAKRDFEYAVPLANPDYVLPTPRESLRRSFDWSSALLSVSVGLAFSLTWLPIMAFWSLLLVPERLIKGAYGILWERRHGVLLWRGRVPEQPLGEGQHLYSSARN
ncbi:hypothetical protein ACWDFL_16140 [Streptomyces bungoensis]